MSAHHDHAERPPPMFLGDHLALDFLNSTANLRDERVEWIGSGPDLAAWLSAAGVLPRPADATDWRAADLDGAAKSAVALREWFRGVLGRVTAKGAAAVSAGDLRRLNEILVHGAAYPQVERTASGLKLTTLRPAHDAQALLAPVATAMADLLCSGDLDLVRHCEGHGCTMWFYDRTKSHRRRWCSQAICGNRAKVAAFRERQRNKP